MFRPLLACIFWVPGVAQSASLLKATPETLSSVIASASGGETVRVEGAHDILTIKARTFAPPIVIQGGSFKAIVISGVNGVTLVETTVSGSPVGRGYGISVSKSSNVRIEKATIGGLVHRGVVFNSVTDFAVINSRFDGIRSDGIDIALSHRGQISDNVMLNFNPRPPIYLDGRMLKDGDHPDGIQLWSRPSSSPTSDIVITGNKITGNVQCIFGGNHIRNGVDDGGFDRITIENNICRNQLGRGITLSDARASRIRFNDAAAIPGSRLLKTGQLIKTQIIMKSNDPTSVACGNKVPNVPNSPAAQSCR